jgi:cyclophilin family peptidyl-prolyl cis-trans isomerase/HEAT repeat protein
MRRTVHVLMLAALASCHGSDGGPSSHSAEPKPASSEASVPIDESTLRRAELRRDSRAVGEAALSSRELPVRRAAARALARIADARAAELLLLALGDEDPEVTTWAAYGLGFACRGREPKTVHALVSRAASLDEHAQTSAPLFAPSEAIADALGRCGGTEAESTLREWLVGPTPRAEAAALALGRIAMQSGKLADATLVALLDAADRSQAPLANALYPCSRLSSFNASTESRVRAQALKIIADKRPGLEFAVRALGHTGGDGRAALGVLLADPKQDPQLRAEAARELRALGGDGQRALWTAFDALAAEPPSDRELESADYGVLNAVLEGLAPPILSSGSRLRALTELAIAEPDGPSLKRRKLQIRCTAAALLAGKNYQSARLLACDPSSESRIRELSVLQVIARDKLRGSRKLAYLARANAHDDALREAAVAVLAEHSELPEASHVLSEALTSPALGVVASAAQVLSRYPERAARGSESSAEARTAPHPEPSVVQALTHAYAAMGAHHNVEVQSLLLDAIGALQILSLKSAVNDACTSDNPTLREHAEKSLLLLGEPVRRCDKFVASAAVSFTEPAFRHPLLSFETDVGSLTLQLDARFAPSAVARIVTLAQAGFYDGLLVHRVVPGFVAQFGDPAGDGYGGDDQPPLRCETSPIAFETGSVGVALAGRDTGSSQLFVTLGRYPHLDGEYAWLGTAGPGWDRLAAGDRIAHVSVSGH